MGGKQRVWEVESCEVAEDERMQVLVPGRVPKCPEICQPSRTEGLGTMDLKTIILTCLS